MVSFRKVMTVTCSTKIKQRLIQFIVTGTMKNSASGRGGSVISAMGCFFIMDFEKTVYFWLTKKYFNKHFSETEPICNLGIACIWVAASKLFFKYALLLQCGLSECFIPVEYIYLQLKQIRNVCFQNIEMLKKSYLGKRLIYWTN